MVHIKATSVAVLGMLLISSLVVVIAVDYEQQVTAKVVPGKFNVFSPIHGMVYNDRMVPINLSMTGKVEKFRYGYIDNGNEFVTLCRDCEEYGLYNTKKKPFDDGFHKLILLGIFETGSVTEEIDFTIETRAPKIKEVFPEGELTSGYFEVVFQEANPVSLVLNYANKQREVGPESCMKEKLNTWCGVYVDLSEFDGQNIDYSFELKDIADGKDTSKKKTVKVDVTNPVFSDINITSQGNRVNFDLEITELNLREVGYLHLSDGTYKKLCGKVKNNACMKNLAFESGEHNLELIVVDEAGNEARQIVVINI